MIRQSYLYPILLILLGMTFACDLSKDIEVELPVYEPEIVVECYLQIGEPYRLLLTRSAGFFDAPTLPLEERAIVTITHNGQTDTLENNLFIIPTTQQVFNYASSSSPSSIDGAYELKIISEQGETLTAQTEIKPFIPIDELEVVTRTEDSLVAVLTRIPDPTEEENYYRRVFHKGGDILTGELEQDFTAGDQFLGEDSELVFGTAFEYAPGDTLISTLYHITEDYYNFLESLETALNSNGNPFVQQESTRSNVDGGIGIFTGYARDRKMVVVPQ
ncbi:MAG: DUF4249 domain-containing protein [Bacteroidota bacterium]